MKKKRPARRILKARDKATRRRIAVKENRNVREARQEFRVMRSYRDVTHLVRAERFFRRKGRGCIVMEWIPGATLRETIQRRGAFEPAKAAAIALNILSGLEELHRSGFVHGDLHSGNVMVTNLDQGAVKIIDFQHAVPLGRSGRAKAKRRLSKPPPALAPESKKRVIDVRYDLYGVGYMTASMLLGREPKRRPRRGPLPKAVVKAIVKRLKSAGVSDAGRKELECSVAHRLWTVALKGAHPDPAKRYPSAGAMARAIENAVRSVVPST